MVETAKIVPRAPNQRNLMQFLKCYFLFPHCSHISTQRCIHLPEMVYISLALAYITHTHLVLVDEHLISYCVLYFRVRVETIKILHNFQYMFHKKIVSCYFLCEWNKFEKARSDIILKSIQNIKPITEAYQSYKAII